MFLFNDLPPHPLHLVTVPRPLSQFSSSEMSGIFLQRPSRMFVGLKTLGGQNENNALLLGLGTACVRVRVHISWCTAPSAPRRVRRTCFLLCGRVYGSDGAAFPSGANPEPSLRGEELGFQGPFSLPPQFDGLVCETAWMRRNMCCEKFRKFRHVAYLFISVFFSFFFAQAQVLRVA